MGTNFYVRGHRYDSDPEFHIGKRSAAGLYCYDCGVTLCKGGEERIHMSSDNEWHTECPKCGKKFEQEALENSSAGVELGFNKDTTEQKLGVRSCSSFSWAMLQPRFQELQTQFAGECRCCGQLFPQQKKIIENEYGDLFTFQEFMKELFACPIRFERMRGKEFS